MSFWHSRCRILERALLLASLLLSVTNAPSATARRRSGGGPAAPTFTGATSAPSTATPENVPVLSLTFATRPWANGACRVFRCFLVENRREMSLPGPDLGTRQWLRRNDEKLHEKSVFFARSATGFCTPKMRIYGRLCRCRSFCPSRSQILEE